METKLNVMNGLIEVSIEQVLTESQVKKFEDPKLCARINAAAKDFQLNWTITKSGNVRTLVTSSFTASSILIERVEMIEKNAEEFKNVVDKMNALAKDINTDDQFAYDFIKTMVDEWDETEDRAQTAGFVILASTSECPDVRVPCGCIPESLAKELCLSYLKVHANG